MYRVSHFVSQFAYVLWAGLVLALIWANLWPQSYQDVIEFRLWANPLLGYPDPDAGWIGARVLTLRYLAGGVLMALFFLLAGKELWEALVLKNGTLRGRKAVVPVLAAIGGLAGAASGFAAGVAWLEPGDAPAGGWVITLGSDIALCYFLARWVFGARHAALRFVLTVTLIGDLAGLLLAGAGQAGTGNPAWLLLSAGAAVLTYLLFNRLPAVLDRGNDLHPGAAFTRGPFAALPFVVAGALSWYGVQEAGLHPALGLLPIVPAMPHADRAFGLFAEAEELLHDLLNRIAHHLVTPASIALFLFGLTYGGAELHAFAPLTLAVLFSAVLAKPLGILAGAAIGAALGGGLPAGLDVKSLIPSAMIAGISVTVPLLSLSAALSGGADQEAARLGVILTLAVVVPVMHLWRRFAS